MAVTIRDVAALAGVSPSTVSRTCKDHSSISKETKEKVRWAMAQLGYEPNPASSVPSGQNPPLIGIILPPSSGEVFENSFYLEAIRGISQFCNEREYVSTVITGRDADEILKAIRTLVKDERIGGFIVLYSREEDPVIDYLYSEGLLYVLIGKAQQFANQTIYIDNDNLLAGKEVTEYLYRLGHRRIAYVSGSSDMMFSSERKAGYQLALMQNELPIRAEYCVEVAGNLMEDNEALQNMLCLEERPTAVVVSDDILAVELERVCVQQGISIPDDLSIISFNNSLLSRITSPQLTSVDINSCQLGIEAASQLINHVENPNLLATKIIVPHTLIVRGSCREIKADR